MAERIGGSSPLTRGTPIELNKPITVVRFIPAYAGNSSRKSSNESIMPVHPRLRGELALRINLPVVNNGSSPLTRGTHSPEHLPPFGSRFIPAYAGNSIARIFLLTAESVHPRLRGELTSTIFCHFFWSGSSPLTRGTRSRKSSNESTIRFIPAYAGNSVSKKILAIQQTVHPRLRGELTVPRDTKRFFDGSSPLTRGTLSDIA